MREIPRKFMVVYNCLAETDPVPEVVATDSIRHVWLELPEERTVVIEYYNQAMDCIRPMREHYSDKWMAKVRLKNIMAMLGCIEYPQTSTKGIMNTTQFENAEVRRKE